MDKDVWSDEVQWFWDDYWLVLKSALTYGMQQLGGDFSSRPNAFKSEKEKKKFLSACHRGHDKAQDKIIEMLVRIKTDSGIEREHAAYFELLLRRVIDCLAYVIFGGQTHIFRRLNVSDCVRDVNIDDVLQVYKTVKKMNSESRMTFALLSDLSTYIQIGDIVRLDLRKSKVRVEIIEIKSGKVNYLLSDFLDRFEPEASVLETIDQCRVLPEKYKKQAKRMMRQRIRISQFNEIVKKDSGIDSKTGMRIHFTPYTIANRDYGEALNDICETADGGSVGAVSIDGVIHIVAMKGHYFCDANALKPTVMNAIIDEWKADDLCKEIMTGLIERCSPDELLKGGDLVLSNLYSMATRPCLIWPMHSRLIRKLLTREIRLLFFFDFVGFIKSIKDVGGEVSFTSKKETGDIDRRFGCSAGFKIGGKYLKINSTTILGGIYSRIINDLTSPKKFIEEMLKGDALLFSKK